MPPRSPLTKSQLETLRRRLEDERKRVLRVLESSAAPGGDDERSELEEIAQRATESTHQRGVADRERELLAEVERALAKLAAGTYGLSEKTGDPIPYDRLRAVPWARQGTDE